MPDFQEREDIHPLPGQSLMAWPLWAKLLLALGLTLATLWARLAFGHAIGDPPSLVLFVLPILLGAYVGGFWPGLLATLAAFLTSSYFLLFPLSSFVIGDVRNQISWLALLVVGTLVSVLMEALQRDRKRLAASIAALRRAEKFRQDVERIVRHDVKSPLAGLHAAAILMLDDHRSEELRELLPGLVRSTRNVINLLDSSDKVQKMEQGGYAPQAAWFDLGEAVGNVGFSLRALAEARHVRLVRAGSLAPAETPAPVSVYGEELLIEDMLTNLLKNAMEACPEGGEVSIFCKPEPEGMRIAIHNPGAIPEEVRERFSEKYATAGKSFGTGLGAYSARLIVQAHGGHMECATSDEAGTTVTVLIPQPAARP
jgi:K+-sensing histidine kinase KdpD